MHSLSVPARSDLTIPAEDDPVATVDAWIKEKITRWSDAGIDTNRIIIDPGVGFGKNSLQSLKLLQNAAEFRRHGLRVLIGHSRKSFMKTFSQPDTTDRDLVTIGASLHLCQQGVDIIRVHNLSAHLAAYRGWSHLAG